MHGTAHGEGQWYHRGDNKRRRLWKDQVREAERRARQMNNERRQEMAVAEAQHRADAMAAQRAAEQLKRQWKKENKAEEDYNAQFKNEHWSDPNWAEEMEDQSDAMRKAAQLRPQLYVPCT